MVVDCTAGLNTIETTVASCFGDSIFVRESCFMDRDELIHLIQQGPVRVRMNNGDVWDIPSAEFAIVGDLHAAVLVRDDDGASSRQDSFTRLHVLR